MNSDIRHNWVKSVLAKMLKGSRILDAGAGKKRYEQFCSHLNYVSQDFCQYDGKGDGTGLQRGEKEALNIDIISDITNIPEPDESFDIILCTEVFEHIPKPIKAIKEFNRLLRSQTGQFQDRGYLILTAPFCSMTHYAPYHYYSGFNRYFYEKFLPENGFEILSIEANGSFFEFLIQELKRIENMVARYTDVNSDYTDKYCIAGATSLLNHYRGRDKNSHEFLCFGYHVLARKL